MESHSASPGAAAPSVSVVVPAFNEAASIGAVVEGVSAALEGIEHEVLVVDDGSSDGTRAAAEAAGARVVPHRVNKGYGAALKTGIRAARHEWVALIDADGQHRAADLRRLIEAAAAGCDMAIGARSKTSYQYAARMPGKWLLHRAAAYLTGERPVDVNSGMRVFRRADTIEYFPILPSAFSFTTTQTLAMVKDGFRVEYFPIETREREGRRSTVKISDGLRTLLLIVRIAALFNPLKVFLPASGLLFAAGAAYTALDCYLKSTLNIPDGAALCALTAVIVFFFGILSDQLASIRRLR